MSKSRRRLSALPQLGLYVGGESGGQDVLPQRANHFFDARFLGPVDPQIEFFPEKGKPSCQRTRSWVPLGGVKRRTSTTLRAVSMET
jgi:hypothetical protein